MEDERRMKSKLFIFFEWLYRLLVLNVLMIIPALPLVTYLRFTKNNNIIIILILIIIIFIAFFPGLVASCHTINDGLGMDNVFKRFFINYKKLFKKAFFLGLIIFTTLGIIVFGELFYIFQDFNQVPDYQVILDTIGEKASSVGVIVMAIAFLLAILMIVNLPLLMINFTKLTIGELIRAAFYLSFRYFLTTFILLVLFIISLGSGILCFFSQRAALLLLWLMIGISLPLFLSVKITRTIYYVLTRKQFERIFHYDEEDDLSDLE